MILHITSKQQWEEARGTGTYAGNTLETEGFIHCSGAEQVLRAANTFFPDRTDLVLLGIDEEKVKAEIRYEDSYGAGESYPHIYGPLNLDAVTSVTELIPEADGTFKTLVLPH